MRGTGPSDARSNRGRALIVLDLTRDRLADDGAWPVTGVAAVSRYIEGEIGYFRDRGRPVVHCVTLFDPTSDPALTGVPRHNLRGTAGAAFADAFAPRPGEIVLEKRADSAFFGTTLWEQLIDFGVDQITIVGLETHTSVLASALDATARGLRVSVPDTCVMAGDPLLHESALRLLQASCWIHAYPDAT
ncbi:MAG: cysteine hydrolase [Deltaproteobacteria bacterium]|nr:cysteine hydrolase [Deltaproteobacteria bacterium]